MINTGIIGFGKMGQIRAQAIENSGLGKIAKIYDLNNCLHRSYIMASDIDEIMCDKDIDAVFICTPNYLNKELTVRGLNAGKHVFCEKPPAFNSVDMEDVLTAEKNSGKKLMYGFNHRHHESIQEMKKLIDGGVYGKILWMRGRYGKSVDAQFFENWRSDINKAGGGILLDQGIHMLDLFIYLGGKFDEVKAFVSNLYWKTEIEDNAFVLLRNSQSGLVASLHSTMTQWRHLFSLEVFLENGYLVLNGLKTSSGTYGEEVLTIAKNRSKAPRATWQDEEKITFDVNISWESEINHFYKAIANDNPIRIGNSNDAQIIMQTIDKIYKDGR